MPQTAVQAGRASPQHRAAKGFTLVELMSVMFILAIIVALVVGVGMYMADEARKRETMATQALVMAAARAFFDKYQAWPGNYEAMTKEPVSQDILRKLRSGKSDGWGKDMEYKPAGGLGGGPVLISGGPDGKTGTEDDIKSDR